MNVNYWRPGIQVYWNVVNSDTEEHRNEGQAPRWRLDISCAQETHYLKQVTLRVQGLAILVRAPLSPGENASPKYSEYNEIFLASPDRPYTSHINGMEVFVCDHYEFTIPVQQIIKCSVQVFVFRDILHFPVS